MLRGSRMVCTISMKRLVQHILVLLATCVLSLPGLVLASEVVAGGPTTAGGLSGQGQSPTKSKVPEAATGARPVKKSRSPSAGVAFWILAACAVLASLASMTFQSNRLWGASVLTLLLFACVLAFLHWPIWIAALVGVTSAAVVAVLAVKPGLSEHMARKEEAEHPIFLSGVMLCAAGVYTLLSGSGRVTPVLVYLVALMVTLLLYVWRLRHPLALWIVSVSAAHLVMAAGPLVVSSGSSRSILAVAAIISLVGMVTAAFRSSTLTILLAAELVVMGGLVATTQIPGGLLDTEVGWTAAVGLPLVQTGMILAVARKLGPEAEPERGEG